MKKFILPILVGLTILCSSGCGKVEEDLKKPDNPTEADNYYWDNSEKVINVINASESTDVPYDKDVIQDLSNRGFTDQPVTYNYTLEGEYCEGMEASEDSQNQSPMYITNYVSANNELWTIYVINGQTVAYPASFNLDSEFDYEILISESESVFSYDGDSNKFYETIPKESIEKIIVVDEINSEALDELTSEEISSYEE